MCALLLSSAELMQVSGADDDESPLAQCRVQQVQSVAPATMQSGVASRTAQSASTEIATNYRHGPSGEWEVSEDVDRNSGAVRLLLVTPQGPLLVDLTILVDGEGFRATRERWIDEALAKDRPASQSVTTTDGDRSSVVQDENEANSESQSTADRARSDEDGDEPSPQDPGKDSPDGSGGEDVPESATEEAKSEEVAAVGTQVLQMDDALSRLRKYATQPGIDVGREEARWLLAQWSPGPDLLELKPRVAAERLHLAPLWAALDTDHDGQLSANEVSSSHARLRALDSDEDDWVDESEMSKGTLRVVESWASFPLITVLDDLTDCRQLARQLANTYTDPGIKAEQTLVTNLMEILGVSSFKELTPAHRSKLTNAMPQMTLRVNFATEASAETGLFVVQIADSLLPNAGVLSVFEDVISLPLIGCVVELSAAQRVECNQGCN